MTLKKMILVVLLSAASSMAFGQRYEPTWESIDSRPVPQWYTDAKFGVFIHWGLYSVPAWGPLPKDGAGIYDCYAEWYWNRITEKGGLANGLFAEHHRNKYGEGFAYQDFVKDFTCSEFDPAQWADVIASSGARYVVLTSKHHDGFALWPSAQSWNWNSVDVGPHRDLAGELTKTVKAKGLKMGFYYSLYEWYNPLYLADIDRYVNEHMLPQLKDLVVRYTPDIVWPDGEWNYPAERWRSPEFLAWLYNDSPVKDSVVVNDRWGKGTRGKHGGYYTTEYDYENENAGVSHPWEECRGIGHSFGYNRNENLEDYSTADELIRTLVEKVSAGGSLLLNIGPTADGRIPVIMQQRLKEVGEWLAVNGQAIYGTTHWNNANSNAVPDVYYTAKGKDLYVICLKFPDRHVTVNGLVRRPASVQMLGTPAKVKFSGGAGKLTITPPQLTPATSPCDHAWVFRLEGCL